MTLRMLTIGHSYVVDSNRSIFARIGEFPDVDMTIASPKFVQGDLRPIHMEPQSNPSYELVGLQAHLTSTNLTLFYRGLDALLKRSKFDLVHAWEEPYTLSGYQIARTAVKNNTPFSFLSFQNLSKRYPPPFAQFEKYCIERCAGWIAAATLVYETLLSRNYSKDNSRVLTLAVDDKRFYPDPERGAEIKQELGFSGPVIGIVGRLANDKGFPVLLPALEKVRAPWNFLVLGSGPAEAEIERWVNKNKLGKRVRVLLVKHDEVADYIRAMDILVAPSQTMPNWREQFGRMVVEAFASRVAVIGSDSGEIPRVIGDAGVVVPEKDVEGWAEAVTGLLTNDELRVQLAERGYEKYQSRFTADAVASSYKAFFESIVALHSPGRRPA